MAKPSKVARRRSSGSSSSDKSGGGFSTSVFGALGLLGDSMDLGLMDDTDPKDLQMVDYRAQSPKRSRSSSKPYVSSPRASLPPCKVSSDLLPSAITQVNSPVPCMLKVGLGCFGVALLSLAMESSSPSSTSSLSFL